MKRRIFFWVEKLKISPAERKTVSGLAILLVVSGIVNLALSPKIPFNGKRYRALKKQFKKRTALIKKKQQKLMQRYHPSLKNPVATAVSDTITQDSSFSKTDKKRTQQTQKTRINVNTADMKALESIPGIGPAYASRILKYRKENGGFKTLEELKKIKGIGKKRLENLKPFVKLTDSKESK
ncbi:MAG TPA: helix-hairpin-helix domain-containing protein [Balneolaceae bacterium]|nr:helix-hairpin-helix domain-containing protein [Balneolaceae bacterium]